MKTDNELIAEFMGQATYETPCKLPYDTSWDWLMPVVRKIHGIYIDSNHDRGISKAMETLKMPFYSTTLGFAYTGVIEFIKWYHDQSKE